jgi:hypothetical protein
MCEPWDKQARANQILVGRTGRCVGISLTRESGLSPTLRSRLLALHKSPWARPSSSNSSVPR